MSNILASAIETTFFILGFFSGLFVFWKKGREEKIDENLLFDVSSLMILAGLFGGRLQHVLLHWSDFGLNPLKFVYLFKFPGFGLELAALFGFFTLIFLSRHLGLDFWQAADLVVPAAAAFLVISLIGQVAAGQTKLLTHLVSLLLILLILKIKSTPATPRQIPLFVDLEPPLSGQYFLNFIWLYSSSKLLLDIFDLGPLQSGQLNLSLLLSGGVFLTTSFTALLRKQGKMKFPPDVLKPIRNFLEDKHKQILKRIAELKKQDPYQDPLSRNLDPAVDTEAREGEGHERMIAMQKELNKSLITVRKALTKIKIGKYGLCENCGKMIDTERLAVMPDAELCLECQAKKASHE